MKRFLSLTASISLLLVLISCTQTTDNQGEIKTSDEKTEKQETIKIGYVGPLTGDAASWGQDEKKAMTRFLESKDYMLGDKKIEIIYEDGQCNGQTAVSAINKLIATDNVQVVLGGTCSGETLAMAPIANENNVVLFSSISTSPEITDAGDYIFRNAPSDIISARATAEDMKERGYNKIAMVTENTDFATAFKLEMEKMADELDMEITLNEVFNPGTTDFKSTLTKARGDNPDVLFFNAQTPSGDGLLVKQTKELGINLPVYASNAVQGAEFFEIGKDATEGVVFFDFALDESDTEVRKFLDFAEEEEMNVIAFAALKHDALEIIYNALLEVEYDGEQIKQWLYDMPEYKGLGGTYQFDENGDVALNVTRKVAQDGEFVTSED